MKTPKILALLSLLTLLYLPGATAEKLKFHERISVGGQVVQGQPLDIGIDHQGVKLESITFDEDEATLLIWNRRTEKVTLNAGIALFDEGGLLIAAESDDRSLRRSIFSIKSGKPANLTIKLRKFISDLSEADQFRLVVALVETEDW